MEQLQPIPEKNKDSEENRNKEEEREKSNKWMDTGLASIVGDCGALGLD